MKKQQESKRHHYLPRLYLKRWCNKENKLIEFQRFTETGSVKSNEKSTKYTGFSWHIYDLDGLKLASDILSPSYMEDQLFKQVDQTIDPILENIEKGMLPSTGLDRSHFFIFVISLIIRNKNFFKKTRSVANGSFIKENLNKIKNEKFQNEIKPFLSKSNGLDISTVTLYEEMLLNKNIIDFFINCEWFLMPSTHHNYLTSDSPVWWGKFPNNNDDFFLMLAVSPFLSIVIPSTIRCVNYIKEHKNIRTQYNDIVCKQARDTIISNDRNQIRFVENRFKKFPDYQGLSEYQFLNFMDQNKFSKYKTPCEEKFSMLDDEHRDLFSTLLFPSSDIKI